MKQFFAAGLMLLSVGALTVSAATVTGTTSGVFSGATGPGGMKTLGSGTNSFTWGCRTDLGLAGLGCFFGGDANGSNLTFAGGNIGPASTDFIDTTAGVLTFSNKATTANTSATGVNLDITMAFTVPAGGPSQVFTYNLGIQNTTNPQGDDIVLLPNSFTAHSFTVAGITYTVNLLGFFNADGIKLDSLFAPEDSTRSATLRASVSATSVPEPTSIILLGSVVSGLAFAFRKKLAK